VFEPRCRRRGATEPVLKLALQPATVTKDGASLAFRTLDAAVFPPEPG
jgi:hypothetical protein